MKWLILPFVWALMAPFIFMWWVVTSIWKLPWPTSWKVATLLALFLIVVNFHP